MRDAMTGQSILWRRLDQPGHDAARLWFQDPHWHLAGAAVFIEDRQPCRLDYQIYCDTAWNTVHCKVTGWVGGRSVELEIGVDPARRWRINGTECAAVAGCFDVDLSFTPATNLLPIRRLQLPVGKGAGVRAAWLRFPPFALKPLEQTYRRMSASIYRYETLDGTFSKDLTVNDAGFISHYPEMWKMEGGGSSNASCLREDDD